MTNKTDSTPPAPPGEPLCRCPLGVCYLHPSLTTCGMRERRAMTDAELRQVEVKAHEATAQTLVDWSSMIEQFCRDLNAAHDEILRLQHVEPEEFMRFDWPEWSAPANSIRWAERMLGKPLSKTSLRAEAKSETR